MILVHYPLIFQFIKVFFISGFAERFEGNGWAVCGRKSILQWEWTQTPLLHWIGSMHPSVRYSGWCKSITRVLLFIPDIPDCHWLTLSVLWQAHTKRPSAQTRTPLMRPMSASTGDQRSISDSQFISFFLCHSMILLELLNLFRVCCVEVE